MRHGFGLFAVVWLFSMMSAFCGETALQALKAIKSSRADASLNGLVEMTGDRGHPQPDRWKALFNDSTARGGVREVIVENGAVLSERTPLRGFAGVGDMTVLNAADLNFDFDKAFRVAEKEAIRNNFGFHSLDYSLRTGTGNVPLWTLRLYDKLGALIGKLGISAVNGAIVQPLTFDADYKHRPVASTEEPSLREQWREDGGLVGKVRQIGDRTGNTIKRTTLRVGGSLQEFFTGERTIDENDGSE